MSCRTLRRPDRHRVVAMGALYKLTAPNGKSYIGITSHAVASRIARHIANARQGVGGALSAALRKYGPDTFVLETLVETDDWTDLCRLEREAIQVYGTLVPHGYNLTTGGEGVLGPRSDTARINISIAQQKRFQNPHERARMKEFSTRGLQSPKMKAVYLARRKPTVPPMSKEERGRRVREAMARPEVRVKLLMAQRNKGVEWRQRISQAKTGVSTGPCSEQRKALISAARRREWADPVIRAKRLAGLVVARAAKAAKERH